jgi:hypothetical protein
MAEFQQPGLKPFSSASVVFGGLKAAASTGSPSAILGGWLRRLSHPRCHGIWKAFTAMAFGCLAAGSMVKSAPILRGALRGIAGGADDGDVSGVGVGHEQDVDFAGEGEGVGAVSYLNRIDALAVVDGVDATSPLDGLAQHSVEALDEAGRVFQRYALEE